MKKKLYIGVFITILVGVILGFTKAPATTSFITKTDPVIAKLAPIINASDMFGLNIFKEEVSKRKNVIVSPLSLFTLFSIIANGADGETKNQIKTVMNIKAYTDVKLNNDMNNLINWLPGSTKYKYGPIAELYNSIWIDDAYKVKDNFIKTSKAYYNSETMRQNLPTVKTVKDMNKWIATKSKGLIKKPIKKIDDGTAVAIMNVLYFNDNWAKPFDVATTKDEKFTLKNGSVLNLKMMNDTRRIKYYEDSQVSAGILDYSRGSMMVLLPKGDIDAFSSNLTMESIKKYSAQASLSETNIKFPKLNLNYSNSLNDTLEKLGMPLVFDPMKANFNNIKTNADPLWISEVSHNCVVKVDEKGTKAAALSVAIMQTTSLMIPTKIKELYLNKPFIFIIKDKTSDLILFIAKVDDPSSKN